MWVEAVASKKIQVVSYHDVQIRRPWRIAVYGSKVRNGWINIKDSGLSLSKASRITTRTKGGYNSWSYDSLFPSRFHHQIYNAIKFAQNNILLTEICSQYKKLFFTENRLSYQHRITMSLHACIKIAQQELLKKLITSARRVRFLRRANCSLCTHFLTRKIIF